MGETRALDGERRNLLEYGARDAASSTRFPIARPPSETKTPRPADAGRLGAKMRAGRSNMNRDSINPIVGTWPRATLPACLLAGAALLSGCSLAGTMTQYRPIEGLHIPGGVRADIDTVGVGLAYLSLGGQAGCYRIPWKDSLLEVGGSGVSWEQKTFGPLLPVLPVFMGWGADYLGIEVSVVAREGSVEIRPNQVALAPTRLRDGSATDPAPVPAGNPRHMRGERDSRQESPVEFADPVRLAPGEELRLWFDIDTDVVERYDLIVLTPRSSDALRLPYELRTVPFVWWMLFPLTGAVSF